MQFAIGQRLYNRNQPGKTADVVHVFDDGLEGWVRVRDEIGRASSEVRVNLAQMREHWTMAKPTI